MSKYQPLLEFLAREYDIDDSILTTLQPIFDEKQIFSPKLLKLLSDDEIVEYFNSNKLLGRALIEFKHHQENTNDDESKRKDTESSQKTKRVKKAKLDAQNVQTRIKEKQLKWNAEFRKRYFLEIEFQDSKSIYCPLRNKVIKLSVPFKKSNLTSAYDLLFEESKIRIQRRDFLRAYVKYLMQQEEKPTIDAYEIRKTVITKELRSKIEKWEQSNGLLCDIDVNSLDISEELPSGEKLSKKKEYELNRKLADLRIHMIEDYEKLKEEAEECFYINLEKNITAYLKSKSQNGKKLSLQEKVKLELMKNIFKTKPKYSKEVVKAINIASIGNRKTIKNLTSIGLKIPSSQTLRKSTTNHLNDFNDSLLESSCLYFKSKLGKENINNIGCISIDSTAINQQITLKNNQIIGFEEGSISVNNVEEWKQFIANNAGNLYNFASNIATIHTSVVDDPLCEKSFIVKAYLKSKYSAKDIDKWLQSIKDESSKKGLHLWFISADFAKEHESFFQNQLNSLVTSDNSNTINLSYIQFCADSLEKILLPFPDIRHLHRNLIHQLISPKKLISIGQHAFCTQLINNLYNKHNPQLNFPRNFFDNDKQNQARADFLIKDTTLQFFKSQGDLVCPYIILTAVSNVVESIRSKILSNEDRLRKLFFGSTIIILQFQWAVFISDFGADYTFSRETITSLIILQISFIMALYKLEKHNRCCSFAQLQEYPTENFYAYCRSIFGSNVNLNANDFMTAINYYVDTLFLESELSTTCTSSNTIRKSNMNYEKFQTKLDTNHISIEQMESIINYEFQRACKEFSSLCESTYEAPANIRELMEDIELSFISKLLIPEHLFNDTKSQNEPTPTVHSPKKSNHDSISKKNNNQQVEINGKIFNKVQLVNQVTSIDRTSLDRSRRRRFDKQPIRSISKKAIDFSQKLLETNEKTSILKLGDFFMQHIEEEDNQQTCIVEIIQMKRIVSKKKKKKELNKEGGGWGGEDYNYSIKWEYAIDTTKGELSDYRFLLKTYQIIEKEKLEDISTQFERVYEEIDTFPELLSIVNGVIVSEIK